MMSCPRIRKIVLGERKTCMLCCNEYKVMIQEDQTFTIDSTDNIAYQYIFNPYQYTKNDKIKVFQIDIQNQQKNIRIALIGSFYSYMQDCAILEEEVLIVLMNHVISKISLHTFQLVQSKLLKQFGTYFSIYKYKNGYVIYGEIDIVGLDTDLNIIWTYSGKDIFVTQSGEEAFKICGDTIYLIDWNGEKYQINR